VALTKHMKTLLAALLSQALRLEARARPPVADGSSQWRFSDQRRENREYEQFGIRHDLENWLGHAPTPSESAVFSRTLRMMELAGLVVRVSRWGRRRTTHVQLTPLGRAEARRVEREREAAVAELTANMEWYLDDILAAAEEPHGSRDGLEN
jgi:DNA-binding PadR family transcriptional regulator